MIDWVLLKNSLVGESDGEENTHQDSDAGEEEDDQVSNSESDESEPEVKKASPKKAVAEESTPPKVVYDFQGSKSFKN